MLEVNETKTVGVDHTSATRPNGAKVWTAFVSYPFGIEEIDVWVMPGVRIDAIEEFVAAVLDDSYEPGWKAVELEERFGLFM